MMTMSSPEFGPTVASEGVLRARESIRLLEFCVPLAIYSAPSTKKRAGIWSDGGHE